MTPRKSYAHSLLFVNLKHCLLAIRSSQNIRVYILDGACWKWRAALAARAGGVYQRLPATCSINLDIQTQQATATTSSCPSSVVPSIAESGPPQLLSRSTPPRAQQRISSTMASEPAMPTLVQLIPRPSGTLAYFSQPTVQPRHHRRQKDLPMNCKSASAPSSCTSSCSNAFKHR